MLPLVGATMQLDAVNQRLKGRRLDRLPQHWQERAVQIPLLLVLSRSKQLFVNTKTNDPEEAYVQLLNARGQTKRGEILPSEVGRIKYDDLRRKYVDDKPSRESQKLHHLDGFFKGMKSASITTDTLRKYIQVRREVVQGPTIRRELTTLRAMFNLARKERALSYDQVPHFPMPDDSLPAGQYITPEQFERILNFLPDGTLRGSGRGGRSSSNLRPFFTFLYATACRTGAAKAILWKDVSEDCTVVEIPAEATKSKQPLRLPLKGKQLEPLVEVLRGQVRDEGPVFDTANYNEEWARACAKAGLGEYDEETHRKIGTGGVRIHDCRCSGAINLLEGGVDEGLVLKIGGWRTRTMLDRYNVTSMERLSAALEKGGRYVTDRIAIAGA
jgi:integrase